MRGKDKKILLELLKDGRQSYSKLGRKTHTSRQSVYSRVKSLKHRGIIKNFVADLDPDKLNLKLKAYILMTISPNPQARGKINVFLKRSHKVSQAHYLFGTHDILLEVLVRNREELTKMVKQFQSFSHVQKTVTMIVYDTIKDRKEHPFERILENQNSE